MAARKGIVNQETPAPVAALHGAAAPAWPARGRQGNGANAGVRGRSFAWDL